MSKMQRVTVAQALAWARQQVDSDAWSPMWGLVPRAEAGSFNAEAEIVRRHETAMFRARYASRIERIEHARRAIVASVHAGLIPRSEVDWLDSSTPMVGEEDEHGGLVGGLRFEVLDAEIRTLESLLRGRRVRHQECSSGTLSP